MSPLGEHRVRAGYPTAEVGAKALDISRVHLSKIECGAALPSQYLLERIARLYQLDTETVSRLIQAQHKKYLRRRLAA